MATYPPDIEAYVQAKIASGQFASRDELAAEAMRLYREMELKHAQLKTDVQAAIDEAEQGLSEPLDMASIKAELIAEWRSAGRSD